MGRFQAGETRKSPQPWWDRTWLEHEYIVLGRSAAEIADVSGCCGNNILYWLAKHDIRRRTIRETRVVKHWSTPSGPANPMYGRIGALNPNWRGGLSPLRQRIYASSKWKAFSSAVRKRDRVCRLCTSTRQMEIHHIHPFWQAPSLFMNIDNVILLCRICHQKMKGREGEWSTRLFSLLGKEVEQVWRFAQRS